MEKSDSKPVTKKEIIIKCSIEEMMKAFFKDYVIVWHEPNLNNKENKQYMNQLKKFCGVSTFTEWEKASTYIKEAKTVCHVITSGVNGELLTKEISTSQSVANIYIFCGNKEHHSSWAKDFAKVSCVETEIEDVLFKIQQNLLEWYKEASSLKLNLPAFAPIFNDSDKSEMNNLHLYLRAIPNFKNREQAKDDFVSLSREVYPDQENAKLVEEFGKNYNEYNKEKTLKWYTRDSFLYRVTNNCLRIATSDSIQYCRLPLKDIELAIKDQYQEKSNSFNGLLYRGAYLSQEEWSSLKENQDKEIEMHGFLSVSKEKNVALRFMRADPSKKVFITIVVPKGPNEEEQGFAEIEEYSQFPQEKEILFNVRSRFTVLETEDDYVYERNSKCRHLVLLYGAQGFRKLITEKNPIQEVSIPSTESISCAHCNTKSEKLLFASIEKQDYYYCKACIDYGVAPFLCLPSMNKIGTANVKGCLLKVNSSQKQTPFYGYKCRNCQAKKGKAYLICTDCGGNENKWCEDCFDAMSKCRETGHQILLETSPFSFWCERMSEKELNHLKFQKNLVQQYNVFQQAEMYFASHKYEKATEYYNLYIQENEAKGKDVHVATSYNNIGAVYDNQGKYKKALKCYLKSLDILKSFYGGDNHAYIATIYTNIGSAYDRQGEYKKAIEYYLKSLDIKKSVYGGDNHLEVAVSYNNIGGAYGDQGEYKKALKCYLKSLDIRKSIYEGDNHPLVATSYNNIGLVYSKQGEYKKALECYLKSLDILKSIYGDNHPDIASLSKNIGGVYNHQGEYKKALEHHLKALDIYKSIYGGDNHPSVATSYQNIGDVYFRQGEHKKALEHYLKSLGIRRSVYGGENHPLIAISYNNIGNVSHQQGEYKKALEYHLKSLNIYKSVYGGENHADIATSYNNIGTVYDKQGEYKKALEYYLKALDIFKSVYGGENHPSVATSSKNIGDIYFRQGEHKKALECYLKSLEIFKSIYGGENHPLIATSYNNMGNVYFKQGEHKKALEYFLKALDIYKSVYGGENHPLIAISYNNIGNVSHKQGEHKKALEYFLKSVGISKSIHGGESYPDIAISYNNIGSVYNEQGEYKKALEYHLKSVGIFKSVYGGDNHPDIATSYNNIADVYFKQGEYKKTFEYFLKVLDIYKSLYGGNHPNTIAHQNFIIRFQSIHQNKL